VLFGTFISDCHKNVTVVKFLKVYKHIFSTFRFSSFSYREHVLRENLMCIVPTMKTIQEVIYSEWHEIHPMLIDNQGGRI
jgi:hypothetical protein